MTKIKSINVSKMGCFDWRSLGNDDKGKATEFKYLNIIYGRNYSGKTTISKIIRSLETKLPPENFDCHDYEINVGVDTYNAANLATSNLNVRVYNKDFVDTHLGFLRDQNNDVTPFAIVGGVNVEVTTQIEEVEEELGSEDKADTLFGKLYIAREAEKTAKTHHIAESKALDRKLKDKALDTTHGIKYNSVYADPNYNINKITADLGKVGAALDQYHLDDKKVLELSKVAQETPLDEIDELQVSVPALKEQSEITKELVEKKIQTSEPIQELLDDSLLQAWVKHGRELHEGKRQKCGFCRNELPKELWSELDAHFNKESQELETQLLAEMTSLNALKLSVDNFDLPKDSEFYELQKSDFTLTVKGVKESVMAFNTEVDALVRQLQTRQESISDPLVFTEVRYDVAELAVLITSLNEIIKANNTHTDSIEQSNNRTIEQSNNRTIEQSKKQAKTTLRFNEVAGFYRDIDYKARVDDVAVKLKAVTDASNETRQAQDAVDSAQRSLDDFKVLLKDEMRLKALRKLMTISATI